MFGLVYARATRDRKLKKTISRVPGGGCEIRFDEFVWIGTYSGRDGTVIAPDCLLCFVYSHLRMSYGKFTYGLAEC
jgi:hypothetical protein